MLNLLTPIPLVYTHVVNFGLEEFAAEVAVAAVEVEAVVAVAESVAVPAVVEAEAGNSCSYLRAELVAQTVLWLKPAYLQAMNCLINL